MRTLQAVIIGGPGQPQLQHGLALAFEITEMAQQHLRNVLVFLNMPTMAQPEAFIQNSDALFNADGSIGEVSRAFLQAWMDSYVAWVKRHNA